METSYIIRIHEHPVAIDVLRHALSLFIWIDPCTSKCTTHPPLPTPLPSTTLLCTQVTNTKHVCVSGGKMAQDVGMV